MRFAFLYPFICLGSLLTSCSQKNENIGFRKIGAESIQFGHLNGDYNIGDIVNISELDTTGIHIELSRDTIKSFSINSSEMFELSNGVQIGNSKKEIRKIMGRPIRDGISLSKGSIVIGSIDAMIYENITIYFLYGDSASLITVGKK